MSWTDGWDGVTVHVTNIIIDTSLRPWWVPRPCSTGTARGARTSLSLRGRVARQQDVVVGHVVRVVEVGDYGTSLAEVSHVREAEVAAIAVVGGSSTGCESYSNARAAVGGHQGDRR